MNRPVREAKIRLQGKYPGREIEANLPEQNWVIRTRIYVVGGRACAVPAHALQRAGEGARVGRHRAAQDIGQRVRRVAESAVTTAFEPQDTVKQNTNGVRDHG